MPKVFNPDYSFYKHLPDKTLFFNPLTDVPTHLREDSELTEFYKLCNEYYSPEFGIKYILNTNIYPFQMAIIRAILMHKFPILLLSRGAGKTFILGMAALLEALLKPNTKIILVSASFRQSKQIFDVIKKIYERAPLLRIMSSGPPSQGVDRCSFEVNCSTITALPLGNGGKIRGERAHTIIVDEFDSVAQEVFDVVIRGFAATQADPWQKTKTLLLAGDNKVVANKDQNAQGNKIILSGTAGFKTGPLYRAYKQYSKILENRISGSADKFKEILGEEIDGNEVVEYEDYCIVRYSYKQLPPGLMEKKIIQNARMSMPKMLFEMEYMAQFGDDSLGFFKNKDIVAATSTFPDGFAPLLQGLPNKRYIMGVDPARTNDRFAICIIELGTPNKLVYATAFQQKKFSEATAIVRDLLRKFNVIGIGMDRGGGGYAVEECLAMESLMKPGDRKIFAVDDGNSDSKGGQKILFPFDFSSNWIEEANTLLQKNIEDKTIMFPMEAWTGSHNDDAEDIIFNIRETKKELSFVEVTYTKSGKKHFDLMPACNKPTDEAPKHKDRYSALLIGNFLASRFNKLLVEESIIREKYNAQSTFGDYIENF